MRSPLRIGLLKVELNPSLLGDEYIALCDNLLACTIAICDNNFVKMPVPIK